MNSPSSAHSARSILIADKYEEILQYFTTHDNNWLGHLLKTMSLVVKVTCDRNSTIQYRKEVLQNYVNFLARPEFDEIATSDTGFRVCLSFASLFGAFVEEVNERAGDDDVTLGAAIVRGKRSSSVCNFEEPLGPLPTPVKTRRDSRGSSVGSVESRASSAREVSPLISRSSSVDGIEPKQEEPLEQPKHARLLALAGQTPSTPNEKTALGGMQSTPRKAREPKKVVATSTVKADKMTSSSRVDKTPAKMEKMTPAKGERTTSSSKADKTPAKATISKVERIACSPLARTDKTPAKGDRMATISKVEKMMTPSPLVRTDKKASALKMTSSSRDQKTPGSVVKRRGRKQSPASDADTAPSSRHASIESSSDEEDDEEEEEEVHQRATSALVKEWSEGLHSKVDDKCFLCEKTRPTYKQLSNHIFTAHKRAAADMDVFKCLGCKNQYRSYSGSIGHIKVAIRKNLVGCKNKMVYMGAELAEAMKARNADEAMDEDDEPLSPTL